MPVVHALAARLRPDADPGLVTEATGAAHQLHDAPGVLASCVGCSDTDLVAAVWLADAAALEPFAASEAHMRFVMRGLAPLIEGMWSIAIDSPREVAAPAEAAALAVVAIPEAPGILEWQVRRQLEAIDELPGTSWVGPTVEERERYRAGGVTLLEEGDADGYVESLERTAATDANVEVVLAPTTAPSS